MISPVSFTGKVFLFGNSDHLAKTKEVRKLKKCAKKNDCDIVVLHYNKCKDGRKLFETFVIRNDKKAGTKEAFSNVFEFNA